MRGFDIWHSEREAAEVVDHGIRVQREDRTGRFIVRLWSPKAKNPAVHCYYRTPEQREQAIASFIKGQAQHLAMVTERKEGRKATPEKLASVEIGSIFHWSYGWEQTNCHFYEVVAKTGQTVTLRELAQTVVPGSQGFMCERRLPRPGVFLANEEPITRRLSFYGSTPSVAMPGGKRGSYGRCGLWDGRSEYCSWYA